MSRRALRPWRVLVVAAPAFAIGYAGGGGEVAALLDVLAFVAEHWRALLVAALAFGVVHVLHLWAWREL